jgi:hypothetical protein
LNIDIDFPGETFPVLKEKEEKQYGEYRTRRFILGALENMGSQYMNRTMFDRATLEVEFRWRPR